MKRWKWLDSTKTLQRNAFGVKYPLQGEALADYVTWNATAAMAELGEALQEMGWKPWAKPRGWVNRKAFLQELVDAAHFIANMATAVDCTDEEWERLYQEKQNVNEARQVAGYDGRNKCPGCGRAYDTETLNTVATSAGCYPSVDGLTAAYCVARGYVNATWGGE